MTLLYAENLTNIGRAVKITKRVKEKNIAEIYDNTISIKGGI